jgi:hypothetical protein
MKVLAKQDLDEIKRQKCLSFMQKIEVQNLLRKI